MKYEKAQKNDLPQLTSLWSRCFGDTAQAVWEFWKIFDRISVYVAKEKAPVAMLCALPVTYFDIDGEAHPASYFYAVCTEEAFRGRGICKSLMDFAENARKKEGDQFVFLTPAEENLFEFYGKIGYKTAFFNKKYTVPADGRAKIRELDPSAYQNLRQMQLYADFVSYDDALIALNPGLYRIETQDVICCAAAEKHGQTLVIKELLPEDEAAAAALAAHLGCQQAQVRTLGDEMPFAMAKSLCALACGENGYLGLAFD